MKKQLTIICAALLLTACVSPAVTHAPTKTADFKAFNTVAYKVRTSEGTEWGSDQSYGKETIDLFNVLLGKRLTTMGYTIIPGSAELMIDVHVTAAKPGSGATRFWVGFGAGRAVFMYHATFSDAGGVIAGFEGGRSYTGMEVNTPAFPDKDNISLMAATRSVSQIEEFMLNGGTFP